MGSERTSLPFGPHDPRFGSAVSSVADRSAEPISHPLRGPTASTQRKRCATEAQQRYPSGGSSGAGMALPRAR